MSVFKVCAHTLMARRSGSIPGNNRFGDFGHIEVYSPPSVIAAVQALSISLGMERTHSFVNGRGISFTGLLAATLIATSGAALAEDAGKATLVVNQAEAGGETLASGTAIDVAEPVRTGANGAALMAMADGTELAVGAESEFTLIDFINEASESVGRFTLEVTSGAMRFATGHLAKSAYTIRTPSAVAAVRGTIFSLYVTDAGETYLAVEEGTVVLRSKRGTKFTVPAGAAMYLNTRGEVDGTLFNPLTGSDVSDLPRGAAPANHIRAMDQALLAANAAAIAETPRALGLPHAIDQGVIDPATLPPFATKTPAYGKSKLGTQGRGGDSDSGGGGGGY